MSQETPIGSLNNMNDDDSKLVESILNDLNSGGGSPGPENSPPSPPPQEQMSPEQMKAIQMQRQMAMQQQQQNIMAQQQQIAQQQKMNQQKATQENVIQSDSDNLIDNIKKEAKSIILVILLSFIVNLEQVDGLLKMSPSMFVTESGAINFQGILLKSLVIGIIYYVVKSYLL
jgi:flagellar motor protein MotB